MIETRNMASADGLIRVGPQQAQWSEWTVRAAVREGYQASSWVYRAVSIIASSTASVPWVVYGADNEAIWEHPVSRTLARPNPHFSRADFFFLVCAWMALAGRAPMRRVDGLRGMPSELWPISPDRIAPKPSADPTKWIDGYEILDERGVKRLSPDYTPDNVLYPKLLDPANPYDGISPLRAAAKAADVDVSAQSWNVAVMQNRAVPEGLFSFKRNLDGSLIATIMEKIKERWSGAKRAREPMVIGDEATYTRLGLTPVELDYLNSRRFSREEIYIVYGVPPQLGGGQESSTYNNFSTSNRIFWETTVIPTYLEPIKDSLNGGFAGQLSPGQWIGYDLSNVAAMQENETERATTAKVYVDMGVPMEQINEKFELGLKPWDGWDKPAPRQAQQQPAADAGKRAKPRLLDFERRNLDAEMASRDAYAEGPLQAAITGLLEDDRKAVFAALEAGQEPGEAARASRKAWQSVIGQGYKAVAYDAAARLLDGQRGAPMAGLERRDMQQPDDAVQEAVNEALSAEAVILRDLSLILDSTVATIIGQVTYAMENLAQGNMMPVTAIQQALTDTGVFSPERALRIARTVAGTAMSVGQMTAGAVAGATHKQWRTGGTNIRDWHTAREGEKVKIDKRFSAQAGSSVGPRYPCDPDVSAADRVNCFLPGTEVRGNVLGAQRARYEGQAVEIVTRGGRVLRVTDHHPVLTENGFVFAGQIQVGDKLLCCVASDNRAGAAVVADEDHKPAEVQQVFGALAQLGFAELPRRGSDDFYGDGQAINGHVEVVWADGQLLRARESAKAESVGQFGLVPKNLLTSRLAGNGTRAFDIHAVDACTAGTPSSSALPFDTAFLGADGVPCQGRRFGLGARLNAAFEQLTIYGATADADALGHRVGGFAGQITGNDVGRNLGGHAAPALECPKFAPLLVRQGLDTAALQGVMHGGHGESDAVRNFLHRNQGLIELDDVIVAAGFVHDGYVYDVMTSNGIVAGGDILTSNCKCAMSFSIEDEE